MSAGENKSLPPPAGALTETSGFDNPAAAPDAQSENDTADRETVDAMVSQFISDLAAKFPKRVLYRPHALRNRVIRLIDATLAPHRPVCRPMLKRITRATQLYRQQFEDQLDLGLLESPTRPEDAAIDRVERELRFVADTVTAILDHLPVQRRPLSDSTKALHIRVVWERRSGYCPACQQVQVCNPESKLLGAEFDHFVARHRNRPEETWLVCSGCNQRLEATHFKASMRSAFEAYQQALRPFLDGGQQVFQ